MRTQVSHMDWGACGEILRHLYKQYTCEALMLIAHTPAQTVAH